VRLAVGDYAAGWSKYSWRHLTVNFSYGKKRPPQPLWLGNWDISGKTLLLHGEQGLGDTIMFARYVPLVAQRGTKIVLAVQRPRGYSVSRRPAIGTAWSPRSRRC